LLLRRSRRRAFQIRGEYEVNVPTFELYAKHVTLPGSAKKIGTRSANLAQRQFYPPTSKTYAHSVPISNFVVAAAFFC
jgi:hypothetical protein